MLESYVINKLYFRNQINENRKLRHILNKSANIFVNNTRLDDIK